MTEVQVELADWQHDHQALSAIRTQVFVEEQHVPIELEIDPQDEKCIHIKATIAQGQIVGTARLLPSRYIGRMCVLKSYRQQGIGGKMLQYLIDFSIQQGFKNVKLNAQLSALPFYQKFGFIADSEIFLEAGIEHKHMTLKL